MTGVLNRGTVLAHAQEEFERFWHQPQQEAAAPSLILFDVDHFKQVNDEFGHLVGDRILRELSERVQSVLRGYDRLGRYGGEEFFVILPAAERIRCGVGDHPFVIDEATVAVTVSLGVASVQKPEERFAAVLKRADEELCLAKRAGRNRAVCAEFS